MSLKHNPILIFPKSVEVSRSKLPPGFSDFVFPSSGRQGQRLGKKFKILANIFESENAELSTTLNPIEPEKVLVLETIGSIDDVMKSIAKVEGLEWLVEEDRDGIEPDDDFQWKESEKISKLQKKMYLLMANKRGLDQFISLWNEYKANPNVKFAYGLGRLKTVFNQLYDVRFWGPQDRLEESPYLADWVQEVKEAGEKFVNVQIELWYRKEKDKRQASEEEIKKYVEEVSGSIVSSCAIDAIHYHGLLVKLPLSSVEDILDKKGTKLVKCEQIMFLRSTPQGFYSAEVLDGLDFNENIKSPEESKEAPQIALLDGLPLENHRLLKNNIIVNDWKEWSQTTPVIAKKHGTQMASTIIYGDLKSSDRTPLKNKIVIFPILQSSFNIEFNIVDEKTPHNFLEIDLIHTAINNVLSNYPDIKIINLSYGDKTRAFYHSLSPLARLLDWLSYRHGILFIISSGNYPLESIEFNQTADDILFKIHNDVLSRKIMSPSESINSLTVGALNADNSEITVTDGVKDILNETFFPSPLSATGLGFSNSVKPDILMPGGKMLFKKSLIASNNFELYGSKFENSPPGILTAVTNNSGNLSHVGYGHGTSYSCALATRLGGQILEIIDSIDNISTDKYFKSLLVKALICHGASWGGAKERVYQIFQKETNAPDRNQIKYILSRIFGYGGVDKDRSLFSTDSRALIIGTGEVGHEQGAKFEVPVPSSIVSIRGRKRITITLSWFSPLNPADKRYRIAHLWFDPPHIKSDPTNNEFSRLETEYRMSRRGTLQHEIFETESAIAFDQNDTFLIQVNCRQLAGKLSGKVKFAIAVSLEVEEALDINIFEEVKTKLNIEVPIQTNIQ